MKNNIGKKIHIVINQKIDVVILVGLLQKSIHMRIIPQSFVRLVKMI